MSRNMVPPSVGPRLRSVRQSVCLQTIAKTCVAGIGNIGECSLSTALLNTLLIKLFIGYCRSERVLAKSIYTCNTKLASARKNSLCWTRFSISIRLWRHPLWHQWKISSCTNYDTRSPVGVRWCWAKQA